MSNRLLLIIAVALLISSPTSGANDTLKFVWPDKMKAHVEIRVKGSRIVSTEGTDAWDFRGTYALRTNVRGDEISVTRSNFSGWNGQSPRLANILIDRIVDLIPSFIVSKDGDYLRIEDVDAAREKLENTLGNPATMSPPDRAIFVNIADPKGLSAITQDYWSTLVQVWRGRPASEMKVELRNRTPIPQLDGSQIDLKITLLNHGPVACDAQDKGSKCVALELRSEADPEQVAAVLKKLLEINVNVHPTRFSQIQSAKLIAEPHTLIPHRLTLERRLNLEMKRGSTTGTGVEENERNYIFTYGRESDS